MLSRGRVAMVGGYLLVLAGLLILTASQANPVFPERKSDLPAGGYNNDFLSELAGPALFACFVTAGIVWLLAAHTRAPWRGRAAALSLLGVVLPLFLLFQSMLLVNFFAARGGGADALYFSVSYFFHAGYLVQFPTIYVLFFLDLFLITLILGAVGYLLLPDRFFPAVLARQSWAKNEAVHVGAALLLFMSLGVAVFTLWKIVAGADTASLERGGFLMKYLPAVYWLLTLVGGLLMFTVAAHTFLLNWGTQVPYEFRTVVDNVRAVARVERGLVGAALALNTLLVLLPQIPTSYRLSESFVIGISPRGFAYAFYLLLAPYVLYALTERRLASLLARGFGLPHRTPFTERALRLVFLHVAGLAFVTVAAVGWDWQPIATAMAFSAWTAAVLFANAVRIETGTHLPRFVLNGEAGAPLYFLALSLGLTTGLMLWGSGNTFEAYYEVRTDTVVLDNPSYYGEDLFARLAAVGLILGSLLLTLHLLVDAAGTRKRFLGHHLALFLLGSLTLLMAFTVSLWTRGRPDLASVWAGFAFHQYYGAETMGVIVLLAGVTAYAFVAVGRMLKPVLAQGRRGTAS